MRVVFWVAKWFNIYPSGHPRGLLTCSKYGRHQHLPLDLIHWEF